MKTSFNINDRVSYRKEGQDWLGTIVKVHDDGDYRVQFDDPLFGGWSEDGLENLWLVCNENPTLREAGEKPGYVISAKKLKRIYDVACDAWQKKIAAMIEPFADRAVVSHKMAEAMLEAATSSQRPVVEDVLKDAGYKFETEPEYFKFDYTNALGTCSQDHPLLVLNGLAEDGFERKEIGFVHDLEWMPVLVREDGTEQNITGLKLRFKARK